MSKLKNILMSTALIGALSCGHTEYLEDNNTTVSRVESLKEYPDCDVEECYRIYYDSLVIEGKEMLLLRCSRLEGGIEQLYWSVNIGMICNIYVKKQSPDSNCYQNIEVLVTTIDGVVLKITQEQHSALQLVKMLKRDMPNNQQNCRYEDSFNKDNIYLRVTAMEESEMEKMLLERQ